tara:strand:- start:520 stop:1185 length:666 start_codon:yes stop_codon:yes gene_type:complete
MVHFQLPRVGTIEDPIRIGILISGSGSGMEALINYQIKKENCFHKTVLVISNNINAKGIEKAQSKKIKTSIIELQKNKSREFHEDLIQKDLEKNSVEVVVLSGYMRILSPKFVEKWMGRLLNIHPSLLPKFPGAHAHKDVLAAGVNESGCTVHFVDAGVDSGPIIAQEKVQVFPEDNLKDLQNRVKEKEHKIYPKVLDFLCEGNLEINIKGEVIIKHLQDN